jgi:hypothetical protein
MKIKIWIMKKISSFIVTIAFIFTILQLSANNKEDKIAAFEKKFAATLSSDEKEIKLVGCRIFDMGEGKDEFKAIVESTPEMLSEMEKNIYIAEDYSYYRMYFPINSAIIDCNGVEYIANEKGVVSLPDSCDIGKIKVIGQKKSGSPTNNTLPDRILFKPALTQGVTDGVKTGYFHNKEKICIFLFLKEWSM